MSLSDRPPSDESLSNESLSNESTSNESMNDEPLADDTTRGFGPSALLTPANLVTLARIAAAPVAFAIMVANDGVGTWALFALWFVLSATDMFDGYLARKHGSTRSGAFLDPLADKVLVLGGFITLAVVGRFPWALFAPTGVDGACPCRRRRWPSGRPSYSSGRSVGPPGPRSPTGGGCPTVGCGPAC